jgi:mRNA interferase MazF
VTVVQGGAFNASAIPTAVVIPMTTNLRWASTPGNVLIAARESGLPQDSVAIASQISTVDQRVLEEHVGRLSEQTLSSIFHGIDVVLGRA